MLWGRGVWLGLVLTGFRCGCAKMPSKDTVKRYRQKTTPSPSPFPSKGKGFDHKIIRVNGDRPNLAPDPFEMVQI